MKSFTTAAAVVALGSLASGKKCANITVPVTVNARNAVFDKAALTPHSNIDVTNFILNLSQQGHNYTQEQLKGYQNVEGTYHLATTYCYPDSGAPSTVQLLTHGIGFDRSYWDIPYDNYQYSYTNEAVDKYGYATFSHDRLGIGMSQHGEPVNEIQAMLEIQALRMLTYGLRNGTIPGVPSFKKVVHIGHSFGSVQTYALTALYPTISDGIGLTGFSQNGTFLPFFELGGDFVQANTNAKLADYPDGYLASATPSAVQTNFLAPNAFDPNILPFAFANGEPVTIGELLTIGGAAASKNELKAPVLIITGERDVPFCGGDCYKAPTGYSSIPETSKAMLPNAAPFQVTIVPGTGHGLNLQYTYQFTYKTINDFFVANGDGPNAAASAAPAPAGKGADSGNPNNAWSYADHGNHHEGGW
ncbi:alpha beta-hydrolase [Lecanosticta acicola]|uniref:Alpha beta-hydrolase n=1 Tax=Lecanosticta acicola TaxID=111012 RepID=A0AAI8YZZ9_9PEZI|nr:alpha beta-hydrolase [Lecanosticta acicola]